MAKTIRGRVSSVAPKKAPARRKPRRTRKRERDIVEIIQEMAREVPAEEWAKLPADLTDHLDHYIYGTPKK